MSEEQSYSYQMSAEQFFVLHAMMRLPAVMGFTDPYRGWLRQELEEHTPQVVEQLEQKGWMKRTERDEEWEIEPLLAAVIAACASDTAVHLFKKRQQEAAYEGYLHITPHLVVERIEEQGQDDIVISVSPLANAVLSRDIVRRFFPVLTEEQLVQITHFPVIRLPELTWEKWIQLNKEERYVHLQSLDQRGWPKGMRDTLVSIAAATVYATARSYRRFYGIWKSEQCGFMLADQMLFNMWNSPTSLLITPYDQTRTEGFVERLFTDAITEAEEGLHGQDLSDASTVR